MVMKASTRIEEINLELRGKFLNINAEMKNREKNNDQLQSAVVREISVIGEAAKKLSEDFKKSRSAIPWKDVVGMRDKLVHNYFEIDISMVWKTIKEDMPFLKEELEK